MTALTIDIVSDIVCPWCLIGVRRMDQALEELGGVEAAITFHPFLLDPTTPDEGADLRDRLRRKFGDPDAMFARVEAAARESGIPLDFSKVRRSVPTVRAHTLLRHAIAKGTQRALKKALLGAYFLEGRDVGDVEELAALATGHGFGADEARAIMRDEAELAETRADAARAAEDGVSGVPFFILGGRLAFSGAHPVESMKAALQKALGAAS